MMDNAYSASRDETTVGGIICQIDMIYIIHYVNLHLLCIIGNIFRLMIMIKVDKKEAIHHTHISITS